MDTNIKCKNCRRAGVKLFLKGDRCYGQKCAMVRRPTAPGKKGKRRTKQLSEYGRELREKQNLKTWYNLREQQFKNYVRGILAKKGSADNLPLDLMKVLEYRLDNVVFRMGFAGSRIAARQLVSHNNFLVNGKPVNLPSYQVKKGDTVCVAPRKLKNVYFTKQQAAMKNYKAPAWVVIDAEKMEGKKTGNLTMEELQPVADIGSVFEFYAR
jgi:small subunit ribosomal protein S4